MKRLRHDSTEYIERSKKIIEEYLDGKSFEFICEKYNCRRPAIHNILNDFKVKKERREPPIKARIERKIKKNNGCWEWQGGKHPNGYGVMCIKNQTFLAHRIAYQAYVGPILEGLYVCHHCDNPKCVNPEHLFLGDQSANMADCKKKDRHARGEKSVHAKLNEKEALEIKYSNENRNILANKYKTTYHNVYNIQKDVSWKHLNRGNENG